MSHLYCDHSFVPLCHAIKTKVCSLLAAESDGEGEMVVVRETGGGEGGRDEGMTQLRKKMKELSATHDVIVRNR